MADGKSNKHGWRFKDLTGRVCGRLVVVRFSRSNRHGSSMWTCLCDPTLGGCGTQCEVLAGSLLNGRTQSCGCLLRDIVKTTNKTHGHSYSGTYSSYNAMKQRCTNPNNRAFHNYGGRGIRVCERWLNSFDDFLADMGTRPDGEYEIDRIDNSKDYEPGNCRWVTRSAQSRNNRRTRMLTHGGRTQCMSDWSAETGVPIPTIHRRLKVGWSVDRALSR